MAAFANPVFYKNQAMGLSNFANGRYIYLGQDEGGYIGIPRGLREELIERCERAGIAWEEEDARVQGRGIQAEFNGRLREAQAVRYELPPESIREAIINSVCHRCYLDHSCVQIAIYDNRVEITSPGMLYGGLTIEQAMAGRSKIRNVCIAEVFSRMGIIEQWGTGIQRMIQGCREYGVREPEFIDMGDAFRVNFYRSDVETGTEKVETGTEIAIKVDDTDTEKIETGIKTKETGTEKEKIIVLKRI